MNNKKDFFSTVFCIFIAVLFILGCNNHLLKPHQDEARLIVKIANSTGARNASTTENNVTAWIENQDGSQSHHQEISTKENNIILTFENIVIGSQINIHLELTKNDDTQTKLTGTSGWKTVKEGEQVIEIPLESQANTDDSGEGNGSTSDGETEGDEPTIVDAETPVIKEINSTIETYTSDPESVTATLKADASVADGGTLTYQWYSSDSPTTDSGTAIEGATSATYEATVDAGTTKYFYCVVTNTNDNVNGNKTASATSNIATVASIVGQLDRITAQYIGSTYELVNSEINYSNIKIVQVYTIPDAEPQEISVVASSVKDQYSIVLQDNNGIGKVPATVTHVNETQIKDDFTIPVKYQLDAVYLSSVVDSTIAQYTGSHSLSATYNDTSVSLELYQNNTSSELTDYVNYTWNPSTVDNTKTTSYTLTVSSKNEWCILPSEGITKEVTVSVTPWTLEINADSPENLAGGQGYTLTATNTSGTATGITYESDGTSFSISGTTLTTPAATTSPQSATIAAKYNGQTLATLVVKVPAEAAPSIQITDETSLVQAIAQAQSGDILTIAQEITITNTITINKEIVLDGSSSGKLLRSTESITNPMFDVNNSGNLTLQNITLDGQNSEAGQANPFIFNEGTLTLQSSTLQKNIMFPGDGYKQNSLNGGAIYSTGTLNILDSTITDIKMNATDNATVSIAGGNITISNSTIACASNATNSAPYGSLGLASGVQYRFNNSDTFKTVSIFTRENVNITPNTISLQSTGSATTGGLVYEDSNGIELSNTIYDYSGLVSVITTDTTITGSGTEGVFISNRTVTLSPYAIGQYEVTQELYDAVMTNNPTTVEELKAPVTNITWYDAVYFCNELTKLTMGESECYYTIENTQYNGVNYTNATVSINKNAKGYRLPSEAEWEFAARGGDTSSVDWNYKYAGSDVVGDVAINYEDGNSAPVVVGTKNPNRLDTYDMSGNVAEWCYDFSETVSTGSVTNPNNISDNTFRTIRGGCFENHAELLDYFLCTYRDQLQTDTPATYVGFRLARSL